VSYDSLFKLDYFMLSSQRNTTARIQSVCNDYNKNLLASVEVLQISNVSDHATICFCIISIIWKLSFRFYLITDRINE